jgi:hypothetical protein
MTTTDTRDYLSRRLRARQAAARCERQAHNIDVKAARYPVGSALRADWTALAADYRAAAADWRTVLTELDTDDDGEDPCPCGGEHPADDHDTLAALDEDHDRATDH